MSAKHNCDRVLSNANWLQPLIFDRIIEKKDNDSRDGISRLVIPMKALAVITIISGQLLDRQQGVDMSSEVIKIITRTALTSGGQECCLAQKFLMLANGKNLVWSNGKSAILSHDTDEELKGYKPDEILWKNRKYRVMSVEDWSDYGKGFYIGQAQSMSFQGKGIVG